MGFSKVLARRDSSANWTSANPILELGEFGFETDTRLLKIGNGADAWDSLNYISLDVHNNDFHSETYIIATDVTFENLNSNGDVGNSSDQVSQGDHNHDSAYEPIGEVSTHESTYDHTQLHEHTNKTTLDEIE